MPKPVKNGTSKKPDVRVDETVTPPHGDPLEEQIGATKAQANQRDGHRREIDMRAAQARWVQKHR